VAGKIFEEKLFILTSWVLGHKWHTKNWGPTSQIQYSVLISMSKENIIPEFFFGHNQNNADVYTNQEIPPAFPKGEYITISMALPVKYR
jgi:hypothetical protein